MMMSVAAVSNRRFVGTLIHHTVVILLFGLVAGFIGFSVAYGTNEGFRASIDAPKTTWPLTPSAPVAAPNHVNDSYVAPDPNDIALDASYEARMKWAGYSDPDVILRGRALAHQACYSVVHGTAAADTVELLLDGSTDIPADSMAIFNGTRVYCPSTADTINSALTID